MKSSDPINLKKKEESFAERLLASLGENCTSIAWAILGDYVIGSKPNSCIPFTTSVVLGMSANRVALVYSPVEEQWVQGLKAGNVSVFTEIRESIIRELLAFAERYVPRDVADDIVQDVFIAIWRRRETVDFKAGVKAYCFGAVRHQALHWIRHQKVLNKSQDIVRQEFVNTHTGENESEIEDIQNIIRDAMQHIPEKAREIIQLRWLNQLSYQEIATVLSISESAARQQSSRAIRVLRDHIERMRS